MAENKSFLLHVVTPDRTFYEGQVEMVEFNTTEGEILSCGVLGLLLFKLLERYRKYIFF